MFGQAHQQVRVDRAEGECFQVIATVERHDRAWCVCGLGTPHRGDLLKRHFGRRLRRRSATLHVQR